MTFKTYTPVEYLMIDIATNFGETQINEKIVDLDKVNFEARIDWFQQEEKLNKLVSNIDLADKPALYFAGLTAYNAYQNGEPTGYAVSLDACASGLQILAALSNCESSALRCGIIDTGNREDAYMNLFLDMVKRSTEKLSATRSDLKQAIMTALYGSTREPKTLFGDGSKALKLFYQIMEDCIPGAWNLNLSLKSLWQPFADYHRWKLPDNFDVSMAVEATETDEVVFLGETIEVHTKQLKGTAKGLSLSPNIIHSIDGFIVREITRRCNHNYLDIIAVRMACEVGRAKGRDPKKRKSIKGRGREKDIALSLLWKRYIECGYLSAKVITLIDEYNIGLVSITRIESLLDSLPVKSFPIMTIHDCFRVHPNYGNDIRLQYNIIMSELAASDILSDIATQITGRKKKFNKVGDISLAILNANYALS